MDAEHPRIIRPQPGPQEAFLASPADIAIYGGAAGSGKTYAAVLEPLRHVDNAKFSAVLFRRTSPELTGGGSVWEEIRDIYPSTGGKPRESPNLEYRWPSGAMMQFLHLQHRNDVEAHQSKQYALILFEELTHFEAYQFWYMVSRMRSMSGIRPYMRATCNPDPDSFVRQLLSWWIGDPECDECAAGKCRKIEHGLPIPERSGVLRWFVRLGNALVWADTREELAEKYPSKDPLSFTFISAKLDDNKELLAKDPSYRARLDALPEVERERLLGGNWNIRAEAGNYIKREYFARRWSGDLPPVNVYMASDYAVSEPEPGSEPDFTEHGIFGVTDDDDLLVLDWWHGQTSSEVWVEVLLDKVARWKPLCVFGEGGVIRKAVEPFLVRRMRERKIYARVEWLSTSTGGKPSATKEGYSDASKRAKSIRGRAFQARAAMGKVIFPANADWADRVIEQCIGFPVGKDDAFDVLAHMCNAIDKAHPAIVDKPPPKKPRDFMAHSELRTKKTWKVL